MGGAVSALAKGIGSVGKGITKAVKSVVGGAFKKTTSFLGSMTGSIDRRPKQQSLDNKIKKQEQAFLQEVQTARKRAAYGAQSTLLGTSVAGDESAPNVKSATLG